MDGNLGQIQPFSLLSFPRLNTGSLGKDRQRANPTSNLTRLRVGTFVFLNICMSSCSSFP